MANYDEDNGVWRTIGGRRVFIRTGQSLSDAMKESGKFSRVAKNQDLYKKLEEENKKDQAKEEKKTIHTASGDYTFEEMQERDKEVKDLFKANWNNEISAKELNDKLDKMQEDGRLSYGERASLQYDASREFDKELDKQPNEETFTQQVDFGGTTRDYNKEDLKRMEENGIRPMEHSYTGGGWEGVNSDKNLDTKDQAKAITEALKKKYPDVKVARKSNLFSGGSSIDFNIMSSDKDLFVSDSDIDKMGYEDLHDVSRSNGFEWWAKDNVPNYNENHSYSIDDVRKYAKQSLAQRKTTDIQGVKGNEWYLNDYGKKVVSDLNKEANSYTYNDSDGMIDYFDHGTYMHISIGKWNKPYQVNQSKDNQITNALKSKAYQNYKKQHPNSKMTFNEFKEMNKK